jgi:hypothetical protein
VNVPAKVEPVCWMTSVPVQGLNRALTSPGRVNLSVQVDTCTAGMMLLSVVGPE